MVFVVDFLNLHYNYNKTKQCNMQRCNMQQKYITSSIKLKTAAIFADLLRRYCAMCMYKIMRVVALLQPLTWQHSAR